MKSALLTLAILLCASLILGAAVVYSGSYNVAADESHWGVTLRLLEAVRKKSIEQRAKEITLPNLDDPALVLKGAGQYAEMCVDCHLSPGMHDTPIRLGLYPRPPDLTQTKIDPRWSFWVIKHGIKMTGMPAWGASHDDETIGSLVAFLNKLPLLKPEQYRQMVASAPPDEEMSNDSEAKAGPGGMPMAHHQIENKHKHSYKHKH